MSASPYVIQIGSTPFDYLNPWDHEFNLRDAVKALAHIPRFGGHAGGYSVAQHCVLVSVIAKFRPWDGLAHDLAEAYYGDFPTPLKRLIRESSPVLGGRLRNIDSAVETAFMFLPEEESVKKADLIALATEKRDLMVSNPECEKHWCGLPPPLGYTIVPLTPVEAEKAWWRRYHQLAALGKAPKFKNTPEPEKT